MKKTRIFQLLLLLIITFSCTKFSQEDLFDESPSERRGKERTKYINILESSEKGWVFQYFALDPNKEGGVNYYLKFKNGYVNATKLGEEEKSLYTILNRSGSVLSFNQNNDLLLEAANKRSEDPSLVDVDFQFLIISATDDEFILEGLKTKNRVRLFKLTTDDYESKQSDVKSYIEDRGIGRFTLNDEQFEFSQLNRGISYSLDDKINSLTYVYTDKGVRVYKPGEIKGVVFDEFILNKDVNSLSTNDGKVVLALNKVLNFDFVTKSWLMLRGANSKIVNDTYEKMIVDFSSFANPSWLTFDSRFVSFGTNKATKKTGISYGTAAGPIESYLLYTGTLSDNEVNISSTGGSSKYYNFPNFAAMRVFSDFVLSHSPYIIEEIKPATSGLQQLKLTSKKDSNVWFYLKTF